MSMNKFILYKLIEFVIVLSIVALIRLNFGISSDLFDTAFDIAWMIGLMVLATIASFHFPGNILLKLGILAVILWVAYQLIGFARLVSLGLGVFTPLLWVLIWLLESYGLWIFAKGMQ
ncbi:MAG: hypothetical protein E3J86_07130 [Candidatus Thorarchaeota archaeon]|nr:MAG: hypothetical protein E3J86_07130 [Candidatus Thorarchaeota archaeon]